MQQRRSKDRKWPDIQGGAPQSRSACSPCMIAAGDALPALAADGTAASATAAAPASGRPWRQRRRRRVAPPSAALVMFMTPRLTLFYGGWSGEERPGRLVQCDHRSRPVRASIGPRRYSIASTRTSAGSSATSRRPALPGSGSRRSRNTRPPFPVGVHDLPDDVRRRHAALITRAFAERFGSPPTSIFTLLWRFSCSSPWPAGSGGRRVDSGTSAPYDFAEARSLSASRRASARWRPLVVEKRKSSGPTTCLPTTCR